MTKIERIARRLCHEWALPIGVSVETPTGQAVMKNVADAEAKLWLSFTDRWMSMAKAAVEEVERA